MWLPACVLALASTYGDPQTTGSGEYFDGKALTMATRNVNVPYGTWFFVTYGKVTVTVKKTDNGPFVKNRDVDLSEYVSYLLGIPYTLSKSGKKNYDVVTICIQKM